MPEPTLEDRVTWMEQKIAALESAVEALGGLTVTGAAGSTDKYLAWHNRNAAVAAPAEPPASTSAPPPAGP